MKLSFIECVGFRGFREKVRIDFAGGATILMGRNGAGKSSIFDAVEFALTGQIDKYRVEKGGSESLTDYLWWRGEGTSKDHYVQVGFKDDDENIFVVTRSRERGCDKYPEEIESVLLMQDSKPQRALEILCKTSIIRDELIAALSVDLKETERFDLVRSSLGTIEATNYLVKAKLVLDATRNALGAADQEYEEAQSLHISLVTHLSMTRDHAIGTKDIQRALEKLSEIVPDALSDIPSLLSKAKQLLNSRKVRLNQLGQLASDARAIEFETSTFERNYPVEIRRNITSSKEECLSRVTIAEQSVATANAQLLQEQQSDAMASALAALVSHGQHIGLQDGHCPLCAAKRSTEEFSSGIEAAKARLSNRGLELIAARLDLEDSMAVLHKAKQDLVFADHAMETMQLQSRRLVDHAGQLQQRATQLELHPDFVLTVSSIEEQINIEREQTLQFDQSIVTLEDSQEISRLADVQKDANLQKANVDRAAIKLSLAQRAHEHAKQIDQAVKRANAEVVDHRLAQISPLLTELYQRLRPHSDWKNIEYSIRGDVRRFLSLRVGADLNPQYFFSSGQRRAAGLAFLLSVHLARTWCKLNLIFLDDPVQHIDDYRALQLVEVLAAISVRGHQVICAVEDEDLAALLARRMSSADAEPCKLVEMEYGANGGASVKRISNLNPLPRLVLKAS